MLSFGVSTWLWTSPFRTETVTMLPKIKEMGFDAVEIPVEYPELIDGKEVKKALEDLELHPVVCAAFGPERDLTHSDPQVHEYCLKYIAACLEISNELGSSMVAGPMYAATGKARMLSPEARAEEWKLAVANLHRAALLAEKAGQQLALEPLNRFETDLVNSTVDMARLIQDIDHPAAKVMLDSYHLCLEERNLTEAIQQVGKHVIHIQVSENYRGTPGTGLTPWEDFRAGLRAIDYDGVISIESFTPEIKELAGAVCFWKPMAESQDAFATEGLAFLQQLFSSYP
ncbi:MAG: sugar phosphate isomerase/epimerase family protein [Bacteroidota bacterium]